MKILIIDGQGGGIGRQLVEALKRAGETDIACVGTNAIATTAMLRAGATRAATGENAALVACREAEVIAGPVGIVIADALLGEVTPRMPPPWAEPRPQGADPRRSVRQPRRRRSRGHDHGAAGGAGGRGHLPPRADAKS